MKVFDDWFGENVLGKFYDPRTEIEEYENATLQLKEKVHELIVKLQKDYGALKRAVQNENAIEKDAQVSKLENKFILMKGKADSIMDKLRLITRKENNMDDILALNDEKYLRDKIDQVKTLSEISREMSQALAHNPSLKDLHGSLLDRLKEKINTMIQCVNDIGKDDKHLKRIYERLRKL